MFRFDFVSEADWPPLAWIAECRESDAVIRVRHGPQVEVRDEWFCEAVWDGEFDAGDFDRTDLVFGSGARLRDGKAVFVSSGSTLDRLHALRLNNRVLISNSLPCVLAAGNIEVDRAYGKYWEFFRSIVPGINAYIRRLPTLTGSLDLIYFRNLLWDGRQLTEEDKPVSTRDFSSFEKYRGFLSSSIRRIAENMSARSRGHRYEMVGTISSGYDSATTAVLCREAGMNKAISFRKARGGADDHGEEVARKLGLDLTLVDRRDWRAQEFGEVPFIAANCLGGDVFFRAGEGLMRGRVLVTGFHGDKVWDKYTRALGPDIVRGDMSGLSFCEYRLAIGCIQFPVAYMGVRQIRDINALSNAPELAHWDVPGNYSRPICRRIVEEAGVPRNLFGMTKKGSTVRFVQGEMALSDGARIEYHRWLRRTGVGPRRLPGSLLMNLSRHFYLLDNLARMITRVFPLSIGARTERALSTLQRYLNRRVNVPRYVFPWAVERMREMYRGRGSA